MSLPHYLQVSLPLSPSLSPLKMTATEIIDHMTSLRNPEQRAILMRFFKTAPGEVQEIWLTFSDPQMKKATKRLTSTYFLQRYRHFLPDGGIIHLKTDSNFLFTYTRYVAERNHLPVEACTEDLYGSVPEHTEEEGAFDLSIRTYYEQQWLSRGITIKYLRFRLPAEGDLAEPDVEIPLDDYRSYNREKRSSLITSK